ncbi:cap-specific mRNA (nucleoside-2'-O-)-methyltransferase 1 [Prorops nasuta]|uniref:cap-specific mRNA (nucleoside-2'-O-)-methyltransferase 1 n=1 Tax=Prorops nasuta TaxID=863751 RepID=UPI0034CD593C
MDRSNSVKLKRALPRQEQSDVEELVGIIEDTNSPVPKKKNVGQRMLERMGLKPGEGLGKHNQGRVDPIEASKQLGRRGLGHYIPGFKEASQKWDSSLEEIKEKEDMNWIINECSYVPSSSEIEGWMTLGFAKKTIDDEDTFCDPQIVKQVVSSKSIFDNLDKNEMRRARNCCNPYETIKKAIFLNRAAVKMANIDSACNFSFTQWKELKQDDLLYFADVCAGPGGFSEYVLWRKKWHAKGFGFTLVGQNDFKLDDFLAGPPETFHPYYGPKENGDVFDPTNQAAFKDLIMKHTDEVGVHFMMSDGGFSVEGQESIQEILSKQLYLCQCLVALMIVREGGHFVTKLFDVFTPFSAGLIYLMYRCFHSVCIFKPNTSRPANSERYLICKGKRSHTDDIMKYLDKVNHQLLEKDDDKDVIELVPLEILISDQAFYNYLKDSNNYIGKKQIAGLLKIAAYCEDPTLIEPRQEEMRELCLKLWNLPNTKRVIPQLVNPQDRAKKLIKDSSILSSIPTKLENGNLKEKMNQPLNWIYFPCITDKHKQSATFYLGMGRSKVYQYQRNHWEQIDGDIKIELPADTLVYAELVIEMRKEGRTQYKTYALHILDSFILGGENINDCYIWDRYKLARKFCKALWKPNNNQYSTVHQREMFPLSIDIEKKLKLTTRILKNNQPASTYTFVRNFPHQEVNEHKEIYFLPKSILFLPSIVSPWIRAYGKTTNLTYVYNTNDKNSKFEKDRPDSSNATFLTAFKERLVSYWPNEETFSLETLINHIKEICPTTYEDFYQNSFKKSI